MTEADRNQIIKLWSANIPIYRMVRMLPYKTYIARRMITDLKKEGVLPARTIGHKRTVIEAYERGMRNPYDIAEEFDIPVGTVNTTLSRAGFTNGRAKRNFKKNEKTLEIIELLKAGESQAEIARKFGVSRQWVSVAKKRWQEGAYEK